MTFRVVHEDGDRWTWRMERTDAPNVVCVSSFDSESLARSDIADFKRSCSGRGIRYAKVVTA